MLDKINVNILMPLLLPEKPFFIHRYTHDNG
jgi:hypothetical protein